MRLLTIVGVLFLSFTSKACAQTPRDSFRQWDSDKSGTLTRDELPERLRGNFGRVDRDRDGMISLAEHTAFLQRRSPRERSMTNATRLRDLPYVKAGHARQKLDLYLPKDRDEASRLPVVVWIHGGGWRAGSKSQCPILAMVQRGYAVASIGYRLSGDAIFPAQIHDCKTAIRWLRVNAEKYGLDPARFGVWGSSAGGHLAALVGTSAGVTALEGAELGHADASSRVQAVCDWFGPTELQLMNEHAGDNGALDHDAATSPESKLLGAPLPTANAQAKLASPLTHVTKDDPPMMLVHGKVDRLVSWRQSDVLYQQLQRAEVESTLKIVPGAGHGGFPADVREECFAFFDRILKSPETARDGEEKQGVEEKPE